MGAMPRVNPGLTLPWVRRLREQIKLEHGQGWSIREQAGKVKLTRRFADGSSSNVSLEIHWGPSCGAAVLISAMASLHERMDNQQLGLAEAHALQGGARTPGNDDAVDWPAVPAAFMESRQDHRPTASPPASRAGPSTHTQPMPPAGPWLAAGPLGQP